MHPLMNRLHTVERHRLMELLGVKESDAALLSLNSIMLVALMPLRSPFLKDAIWRMM